jgi:hypothetical protein
MSEKQELIERRAPAPGRRQAAGSVVLVIHNIE